MDVSLLFHAQIEGNLKCEAGEGSKGSTGGGLEEQRRLPVTESSPNPKPGDVLMIEVIWILIQDLPFLVLLFSVLASTSRSTLHSQPVFFNLSSYSLNFNELEGFLMMISVLGSLVLGFFCSNLTSTSASISFIFSSTTERAHAPPLEHLLVGIYEGCERRRRRNASGWISEMA